LHDPEILLHLIQTYILFPYTLTVVVASILLIHYCLIHISDGIIFVLSNNQLCCQD